MDHGKEEGQVGSGPHRQPFGGAGGGLAEAGIQHHYLHPFGERFHQILGFRIGNSFEQIAPGINNIGRVFVIPSRLVKAVSQLVCRYHGVEAQSPLRSVVGTAKGPQQIFKLLLDEIVGGGENNGMSAVALFDI